MNFNRYFALVALLSASIFFPRLAFSQTTFAEKVWWTSDHNRLSVDVHKAMGIPQPTLAQLGEPRVNGAQFKNAAGAWPTANVKSNLPFPGKSVPIDVVAKVKPVSVGRAIGRFAAKVSYPLVVGVALYDFAKDLGFNLDNSGGETVVTTDTASYTWKLPNGLVMGTGVASPTAGFRAYILSTYGQYHNATCGPVYGTTTKQSSCTSTYMNQIATASNPVLTNSPSSADALADAIAAQSGWPAGSHINRVIVDAIKSGEAIETDPPVVSGPASKPGPSSTTQNPDGSTTTVVVNHNYTYNGPQVTVTSVTTTTTTPVSGPPVVSTQTDTEPAPDTPSEEDSSTPTDTPLPGQPKLYEPKYPGGLVGVWNSKKAQLDSTPLLNLLGDLMPNVASSGSCPSWIISMDLDAWNFGAHDVSPPCWLWDFAKVVIIASALLLARRLVFGG